MTVMQDFFPNYPKDGAPPTDEQKPANEAPPTNDKAESQPSDDKKKKTEKSKKTEECDEEKKYKCLPREIRDFFQSKHGKSGLFLYDRRVFEKFDWSEMKRLNIKENEKEKKNDKGDITSIEFKNPPTIVLFPNMKGRAYMHGSLNEDKENAKGIPLLVKVCDSTDPKDVVWLDEYIDKKKVMKIVTDEKFFTYIGSINGENGYFYSQTPLDAEIYDMDVVHMPLAISTQEGMNTIMNRFLVINKMEYHEDFSDVADKQFDSIHDISPVWDYPIDRPLYDEVETFIILSATMFMRIGFPAINLIICGSSRARKTAWLDSFQLLFKDEYLPMQHQVSEKGLLVSHYGNKPTTGFVFNAKYVCMLDEFMRGISKAENKEGRLNELVNNFSQFMLIVERSTRRFTSGKGAVRARLNSSWIATDNFVYKEELAKAYSKDPASFRRFAFLKVSEATEERGRNMLNIRETEIPSLIFGKLAKVVDGKPLFESFEDYAKFFRFARNATNAIRLTHEENIYIMKSVAQLKAKYGNDFFLTDTATALYSCWKFWNTHIKTMPIEIFEQALDRIGQSHKEMLIESDNWKDNVKKFDSSKLGWSDDIQKNL